MTLARLVSASSRSIFRNKMRSFLTSLGIIIGVCSVIVMVAVGSGSQAQVRASIEAMGTNLIMVMPPRGPREANRLSLSDVERLKSESSYLSGVSGVVRLSSTVVGGTGSRSTSVSGVGSDYFAIKGWTASSGDLFEDRDLSRRAKVAVIGATVAEALYQGESPIGQSLRIGSTPFTVIGVLAKKGAGNNGNDQDDVIFVPIDTALNRLSRDGGLQSIEMSVARDDLMDLAQAEIIAILREAHRLTGEADNDFSVMNQAEIIETASATSRALTSLLAAIAGVSLVVGGIGIMNIMLVSVTERTREIGIRMSVGARRRDILLQFLMEAVILSLLGGAIGIALAVGLCWALEAFMAMPVMIEPLTLLGSAGFSAAVGVFFGFYPARKAANLYPIEALRYE